VPVGVVTVTAPVVAPLGTVAVICESELTVKPAVTPLNLTEVAPVRWEPAIVTAVPTRANPGERLEIAGAGAGTPAVVTVNLEDEVALPAGVVTAIEPLVAPAGTVTVSCESETTVNGAAAPFSVTAVAPVKCVP
jgi:hypothetical protein